MTEHLDEAAKIVKEIGRSIDDQAVRLDSLLEQARAADTAINVAFEIVESWVLEPQAALTLIPRLCEALRACDSERIAAAFQKGLRQ